MNSGDAPRAGLWQGRFTPRQRDWVVVGATTALSLPALVHADMVGRPVAIGLATLPFGTLPLLWRRSHPGPVLAVVAAAFALPAIFGNPAEPSSVGLLVGVGSAALYGDARLRHVTGAAAVGSLLLAFTIMLVTGEIRALGHLTGIALGSGVAWVVGDHTRTRRAYLAQLEERANRLEREREDHARRAAEAERHRIARELHDVVAHNVSVIAVQAGAARIASKDRPGQAAETLELIERTARSTLAEVRTVLGILRRADQERPGRGPQPTLAQLDALLTQAREAGLSLEVRLQGDLDGLPAVVDLAAYRIVQEALTNVMKHASRARVHLLVSRGDQAIDLVVVDDGPGAPPNPSGGQGLIGMRERAALVGGQLTAGPALGGGFRVQAHLPVEALGGDRRAPDAPETPVQARLP